MDNECCLAGAQPIRKATIMPRGHALGMVSYLPEIDKYDQTKQVIRLVSAPHAFGIWDVARVRRRLSGFQSFAPSARRFFLPLVCACPQSASPGAWAVVVTNLIGGAWEHGWTSEMLCWTGLG